MNPLSPHALRDAPRIRSVVSWIAVGTVTFALWFTPACASICANMIPEASAGRDACPADAGMSHKAAPKSDDCQTRPCQRLQAGLETQGKTQPASPLSMVSHFLYPADPLPPLENPSRQPLAAMSLGPPVPPPLFSVLRA